MSLKNSENIIGLICGGKSREREISLRSGKNVRNILENIGYKVIILDIEDNLISNIMKNNISKVYNVLHGEYGEDGKIQGLLESFNIKYTGSKVLGSAICINKVITKRLLQQSGIPTAEFFSIRKGQVLEKFSNKFIFPCIVKPVFEGSSIGIEIVENREELERYINENLDEYEEILVEKYIEGREITVSIVGTDFPKILPILELKPVNRFYDFDAKYTPGKTEFVFPEFEQELFNNIKNNALKAHNVCQCYGVSRIDMIIDKNNIPYILEINTSPGMTDQSDLPAQAEKAGMTQEELVQEIIKSCY